jgi:hypothetical protein
MPCNTQLKPRQTVAERMREVRKATARIDALLAAQKVKVKVGKKGGVVFIGIPDEVRDGMTDACVYRAIMAKGSHASRQAIVKAEHLAGRAVDRKVVATGLHSHDGGATWHGKG